MVNSDQQNLPSYQNFCKVLIIIYIYIYATIYTIQYNKKHRMVYKRYKTHLLNLRTSNHFMCCDYIITKQLYKIYKYKVYI